MSRLIHDLHTVSAGSTSEAAKVGDVLGAGKLAFRLRRKVGGGGMAVVFAATREGSGDAVALKVIRDELRSKQDYEAMFLDEARILSLLSHPHIVETLDYGVMNAARFIAMELLLGRSLMEAFEVTIARGERVPLALSAWICSRMATALDYAHHLEDHDGSPLQVIHRDVNPTNIFITWDGRVKLIDFGLAKAAGRISKSAAGVIKGKFPYLAPEQVQEVELDARADQYALGTTLWELTTGKRLFKRDTDLETLRAVVSGAVPDPRTIIPGYPALLWEVVERTLRRDRDARYPRASAVSSALEEVVRLTDDPFAAPMPERLAVWLSELFPGSRAVEEGWLAKLRDLDPNEIGETLPDSASNPGSAVFPGSAEDVSHTDAKTAR